ncbi:DUF1993 family protein [Sphingopyxis alaskensis]|jgi:hypothetical protein|uniref:DUF1993 domain-containing protein n=1 Tax=Sphingopyxis alaskensis (strain DSM 13593 / LMG 18877 / RB2256) TaxID=317655 RepID=Q1GRM5_SPHAL|nr:DUF1993 domain-containing protein [Sphingopyxis alaskensis]ABF53697.1 conserved hypothetical protein [Sphingopyxis alaskensis RB2256]MCM3419369.1 DUF1993 domain-containing protein [Sphingopyxis alaskensis]
MLYDMTVPAYVNGLNALSAQLDKARAWGADNGVGEQQLLAARLAPDMFPLAAQIRFACMQAVQPATRLGAAGAPGFAEDGADFAALQAQIADALAWLGGIDRSSVEGEADRPVSFDLPNGMVFDMTALTYVRDWAQPQFYFHLVAAYAILRHMGAPLGKADYVGYMMAYLRPGTAPTG